jgi:class 3 adenylate cyclase/tetratricopeptide (TPR) repeat protein
VARGPVGGRSAEGVVVNCSSCGFENGPNARFCGGCGKELFDASSQRTPAERRQLTVLMCDLVGSTELSLSLDPEDLRELLADYQRVCLEAADHHEGHVAQYLGDGVLIYFGFPHAHEDDARRAVRCGLDILSEMRGRDSGSRLEARIGAHTGRVVIGTVGPQEEYLAHGDTPNIAARVQSVSDAGELVVSDAVWRIVQGYFQAEPLGERQLKGLARPVPLWRVTAVSGAESRLDASFTLTDYVGRDGERTALQNHWETVKSGEPRFVTVRGEAGIGKSRLVHEFRQHVTDPGVDQLALRFTPYSQNSAFLPVIELIESRLGLDRSLPPELLLDRIDERLDELGVTAPDAAPLYAALLTIPTGDRYPPLDISPARRRLRTLEVLVSVVEALASRRPTVLVAEDLHWADASTLELLHLVVSSAPSVPLLALFTARPEFQAPWAGHTATALVEVSRLRDAEVESVARAVAGGKTLPGEVMRLITERCDGVPLFVEEVVHAVIESGALDEHEFSWELTGPLPDGLIPATVDASLMARIDNLGDARGTAQVAATIGREFSWALLRAVSDRSEEALSEDLQRIVAADLARQTSDGTSESYEFKHALVQEAAYESLLRSSRQRFHARIATVLQTDFASEVELHPEVVARHLSGAGRYDEAADYWSAAGQNALARMAIPEAHGHFTRALEGLSRLPETPETLSRELDLQIAVAPTLMTVHGWASPTVAEACERARELCGLLDRPDQLYPAIWGLWTNYFVGGQLDRALETADEALAMALASGMPMLEVTGRHAVAYTRYYRGEWDEAIPHAEAGIALYSLEQERELTSMFQLSSTVNLVAALGSCHWMMGHQDRALQELDRMIRIARDVNHPSALSNALGVACYMLAFHHDFPLMFQCADEVKSFAREEGWDLWYSVGVMSSGWSRFRMGDRADGLRELFEGVTLFRATRSNLMGPTVAVIHGEGLRATGRREEALEMLTETAETAHRGHVGVMLPDVYRLMGEIQLDLGHLDAAENAFHRALDTAGAQKALSLELRAAISYHEVLERTGRHSESLALIQRCYERFTDSLSQPDLVRARTMLEEAGERETAAH